MTPLPWGLNDCLSFLEEPNINISETLSPESCGCHINGSKLLLKERRIIAKVATGRFPSKPKLRSLETVTSTSCVHQCDIRKNGNGRLYVVHQPKSQLPFSKKSEAHNFRSALPSFPMVPSQLLYIRVPTVLSLQAAKRTSFHRRRSKSK